MSRALDDLAPAFRPIAVEFLARCAEVGLPVMIVDTLRTPEEHAKHLAEGRSWIRRSKHLDGLAMDVCPYLQFQLHGPDKLQWDGNDPVWQQIGKIADRVGAVWGGRWLQRDLGHIEMPGGLR